MEIVLDVVQTVESEEEDAALVLGEVVECGAAVLLRRVPDQFPLTARHMSLRPLVRIAGSQRCQV